jgi:hypothetical protein
MAQKKPLVLNGGQIEQLQSTDYISNNDIPQLTNGNAGSLVIGTPVYASGANTVDKARANAVGTTNVVGLVYDASISAAASGGVLMDGILSATTGQWDAVAGTTGGLTRDTYYYLSTSTAGLLTSTAPSSVGEFVVSVGIAISTTELKIEIQPRIKL